MPPSFTWVTCSLGLWDDNCTKAVRSTSEVLPKLAQPMADLFIDGIGRSAEEVGGQLGEETLEPGGLVQSEPGAGQARRIGAIIEIWPPQGGCREGSSLPKIHPTGPAHSRGLKTTPWSRNLGVDRAML